MNGCPHGYPSSLINLRFLDQQLRFSPEGVELFDLQLAEAGLGLPPAKRLIVERAGAALIAQALVAHCEKKLADGGGTVLARGSRLVQGCHRLVVVAEAVVRCAESGEITVATRGQPNRLLGER